MRTMNEHSDTKLYNGATGAPKHVCKLQLSSTMDNGIQYISKKEHISEEHLMKLLTKEVQLRCAEVDDMINKGKAALKKNFPSAKTNEVNAALNAQSLFHVENLSVARSKLRIILRSRQKVRSDNKSSKLQASKNNATHEDEIIIAYGQNGAMKPKEQMSGITREKTSRLSHDVKVAARKRVSTNTRGRKKVRKKKLKSQM